MWARVTPEGYELNNVPFYARSLAYRDVVAAQKSAEGRLEYRSLIRASGHSTVRLLVTLQAEVEQIREEFRKLGCTSELSDQPTLVAIDIPPDVPYARVKVALEAGEAKDRWDYQEACLGQ
jgi:hypothetical protein